MPCWSAAAAAAAAPRRAAPARVRPSAEAAGTEAARGRDAWRSGLQANCQLPCRLNPAVLSRFLKAIPPMRQGEVFSFLFTPRGVTVRANGQLVGTIPRPHFAEDMLAAFLGQKPGSRHLKQALLGHHPPTAGITVSLRR